MRFNKKTPLSWRISREKICRWCGSNPWSSAPNLFWRKWGTSGAPGRIRISPKVQKFNFVGGVRGVFLDFDDTLWSKSLIYTLCVPLGPKKDATVNKVTMVQCKQGNPYKSLETLTSPTIWSGPFKEFIFFKFWRLKIFLQNIPRRSRINIVFRIIDQ